LFSLMIKIPVVLFGAAKVGKTNEKPDFSERKKTEEILKNEYNSAGVLWFLFG
jgi:hypothetical protein